jgi:hypothetical protein
MVMPLRMTIPKINGLHCPFVPAAEASQAKHTISQPGQTNDSIENS